MPSFLIVHSAVVDGRIDAYLQPPLLDVGGLRAPLDWGDVTLHVPAGDLPVTIAVTRANGMVEGARITVRAPAGTGTRLTFIPPLQPGDPSQLRIEGQWPSDPSMFYYAARDARTLTPAPPPRPSAPAAPASAAAAAERVQVVSGPSPASPLAATASQAGASPMSVGPVPGSTGSVPHRPTHFGHEQGSRVDPVQAASGAHTGPAHATNPGRVSDPRRAAAPAPRPSFGQRGAVERDVYGREHAVGDRQPPPIPTPADFDRLEREAHEAQVRAYESWQRQQAPAPSAGPSPHDGAPPPLGLAASGAGHAGPDWYADPFRRADARWFDGQQWTASVMRGGARGHDQPG